MAPDSVARIREVRLKGLSVRFVFLRPESPPGNPGRGIFLPQKFVDLRAAAEISKIKKRISGPETVSGALSGPRIFRGPLTGAEFRVRARGVMQTPGGRNKKTPGHIWPGVPLSLSS